MKNEDRPYKRQVWKFQLGMGQSEIQMPFDAEVAYFDFQGGVPCIWALVDPQLMTIARKFQVFGTGQDIPENAYYVGTQQAGPYVWHLFELL